MKSGPFFRTQRALALFAAPLLVLGTALCGMAAGGYRAPRAKSPSGRRTHFDKPLSMYRPGELPLQRISQEQADAWARQAQLQGRGGLGAHAQAPAPPPTTPQFIDLTTTPRPPLVGTSTLCQEIQPAWSWDQQTIYFASNNVDPVATYGQTRPPANALNHIYQMTSDGAFIQQVTGTGNNPNAPDEATGQQLFPALNHAQTKLAYVHRANPASPYQLYVLTFSTDPTRAPLREQITGLVDANNSLGYNANIVNVEHPTWDPGDNFICFAARNKSVAGDVRNIYAVNIISHVVYRLTNGTPANGVECIDPVYHPSAAQGRVCFAANTGNPALGAAVNPATGDLNYRANPLQPLRSPSGPAVDIDHNLFTVPATIAQLGPSAGAPVQQITTDVADDIEPAYEQSVYPPGKGTGAFNNFLAWSSLGRKPDAVVGGVPQNSYDIFFNNGSSEASNAPIRLFTPDTDAGVAPLHQTDERYPTWSSALPPQNPIDRIAFSSNRQNNTADLTKPLVGAPGDTDIWAAEVTDITPPTLFPISEYETDLKAQYPGQDFSFLDGEVLHISNAPLPQQGRRIGAPHDTFYFYAKLKDLQYGVESVWVQIKDPDGASTDAKQQNHKLYGEDLRDSSGNLTTFNNVWVARSTGSPPKPTHMIELPMETDFEGIGAHDYQYYAGPNRVDIPARTRARFASFDPGVDDAVRWSGNQVSRYNPLGTTNRPPLDSNGNTRWLQLHDDGKNGDLVAGDGIFTATWVTPDDPSDFYVDLIAYDKAYDPQNPSHQGNWIIYDNIWGFSTQPFSSHNPVLMVDDNGAGQKWPRGLKGSFRPFWSFRYGTESDIMDRPESELPEYFAVANPPNPQPFQGAGSFAPGIKQNQVYHFLDGDSVPYDYITWIRPQSVRRAYRGDIWRILAKGPLSDDVLNDYIPTRDTQPADALGSATIQRPVPRRAILWSSPYTGDIYAGSGTILDQNTQTRLTNYRNQAGRLVVAGGDILWALTVDGTQTQPFVQNVLGANYTGDAVGGNWNAYVGTTIGNAITLDAASGDFAENPIPTPPSWPPYYAPWPLGTPVDFNYGLGTPNPMTGEGDGDNTGKAIVATDGTPFQTQDGVTARPGWEQIFQDRMVANDDAGNTNSKTVFMSFSLASMGRRYTTGTGGDSDPLLALNYRAKISHAMFCWMFSADLVGQIRNINGGAPISGAFVQLSQNGKVVGTAFSKADGTYTVRGLPVGDWGISVTVPGFATFNKAIGSRAHGLDQAQADVLLTPAAPGSISGTVLDQFGQPVPNSTVQAHLRTNGLYTGQVDFFTVTQADGTYTFPSLPTGSYDVTLVKWPNGFSNPQPKFTNPVTVNTAQNTPNVDFTLEGGSGSLTVTVYAQLADGTKGGTLAGASVTVTDNEGASQTATTDANGNATFNNVGAGPATVYAFLLNYQEATTKVNIPQTTQVDVLLAVAAHPVVLYGEAVRAADGKPLQPEDLTQPVTLQLLRKASQLPLPGVTANVFSPEATTPVTHNYKFTNAQEGRYTVSLTNHPRFKDASIDVDIAATGISQAKPFQLVGKDGTIRGTVLDDQGKPVAGATVQLIGKTPVAGTVVLTLTTQADGTFASDPNKLITSDVYDLQVTKFGYASATKAALFVAGDTDAGTITIKRLPRGEVFGLVSRVTDGAPLDGVKILFFSTNGGTAQQVAQTTSANPPVNGPDNKPANYSLGGVTAAADLLPPGTYQVKVTGDPRFAAFSANVTVAAGTATRVDIPLTPNPGTLSGRVVDANGKPISGATVKVAEGANIAATVLTDANGSYTTAQLPAGSYTATASAFGFVDNGVTVFIQGPTTAPDIVLQPVPPSPVSGAVQARADGSYIGGVKVDFLDAAGNVVATTTTTDTATGSPAANYQLTVPPGTYTVRASKTGWNTATLSGIQINPNTPRTGVNLLLDAEHTFGKGLVLISLPYDTAGVDAATALGLPTAGFKAAWHDPSTPSATYDIYPNGGAKEFRLGKALFALGYYAGCRASDVCWFRLDSVHHLTRKSGEVTVGYKRGQQRTLDLVNEARKPLRAYLEEGRKLIQTDCPFVFLSQREHEATKRNGDHPRRLTEGGLHAWWRGVKEKATRSQWELIADITFHDLRHDFGHRLRAAGFTLEEVAVALGHVTKRGTPAIATTARYTQPNREQMKQKLNNLSV